MAGAFLALSVLVAAHADASPLCVNKQSGLVRLRAACKRGENPLPIAIEDGGKTIRITGVNVQIVNGEGDTATPNGTGNLILGYNEQYNPPRPRGGSHNLVVGRGHGYSSFAGIVAGDGNTVSAPYASVTGGRENSATSDGASVCGGQANKASGLYASVAGGRLNSATSTGSSVSGGSSNKASTTYAWVGGGWLNEAKGNLSAVSGGWLNEAVGTTSSVAGGWGNAAGGTNTAVSGGVGVGAPNNGDWAAGGLYQPGS